MSICIHTVWHKSHLTFYVSQQQGHDKWLSHHPVHEIFQQSNFIQNFTEEALNAVILGTQPQSCKQNENNNWRWPKHPNFKWALTSNYMQSPGHHQFSTY